MLKFSPSEKKAALTYTFIGRGPLHDTLANNATPSTEIRKDRARVKVLDDTAIVAERSSDQSIRFRNNVGDVIQSLYTELDEYYLDTQKSMLSGPHGMCERFLGLGEPFFGKTIGSGEVGGRPVGTVLAYLSCIDNYRIRISSEILMLYFTYEPGRVFNITGGVDDDSLFMPPSATLPAPMDSFLSTKFDAQFTYFYISKTGIERPDVYEWTRRFDNYLFTQTPDFGYTRIVVLKETDADPGNAGDLASKLYLRHTSTSIIAYWLKNNIIQSKELTVDSRMQELWQDLSNPNNLQDKNIIFAFTQAFGCFLTVDDISVLDVTKLDAAYSNGLAMQPAEFANILINDKDKCLQEYSGLTHGDHRGVVVIESSTIKITSRTLQSAHNLVQNILADIRRRNRYLKIIKSLLNDSRLDLWTFNENKKGLLVTLLNYLTFPLNESKKEKSTMYAGYLKKMLDDIDLFDFKYLIQVVGHLQRQIQYKNKEIKNFSIRAREKLSDDIFETINQHLDKTSFLDILKSFSVHWPNENIDKFLQTYQDFAAQEDFALEYDSASKIALENKASPSIRKEDMLSSMGSVDDRTSDAADLSLAATPPAFPDMPRESLISRWIRETHSVPSKREKFYASVSACIADNMLPEIIKKILTILSRLSDSRTYQQYRKNLLSPFSEQEKELALGPYFDFTFYEILKLFQTIHPLLANLDKINAYYALLTVCRREGWGRAEGGLQQQIEAVINLLLNNDSAVKDVFPYANLSEKKFAYVQSYCSELQRIIQYKKEKYDSMLLMVGSIKGHQENIERYLQDKSNSKPELIEAEIQVHNAQIQLLNAQIQLLNAEINRDLILIIDECEKLAQTNNSLALTLNDLNSFEQFETDISEMDEILIICDKISQVTQISSFLLCEDDRFEIKKIIEFFKKSNIFLDIELNAAPVLANVFSLSVDQQKKLYYALDNINHPSSVELCILIQGLYENISSLSCADPVTNFSDVVQYFEDQFYRSYRLSNRCIYSFNVVSKAYLNKLYSDKNFLLHRMALFFRHLYGGSLFSDFVGEYPLFGQENFDRKIFDIENFACLKSNNLEVFLNNIVAGINSFIRADRSPQDYIDRIEKDLYQYNRLELLAQDASVPSSFQMNTIYLQQAAQGGMTAYWMAQNAVSEKYISSFNKENLINDRGQHCSDLKSVRMAFGVPLLLNADLISLGPDWAKFIELCVWLSTLANASFFSYEQISYVCSKISNIVFVYFKEENSFLESYLISIRTIWQSYLCYTIYSQCAAEEWINPGINLLETAKDAYLKCNSGDNLFGPQLSTCLEVFKALGDEFYDPSYSRGSPIKDVQKTLWLYAALGFYSKISDNLMQNRKNFTWTDSQGKEMLVARILVRILGSDISAARQKDILTVAGGYFSSPKARTQLLDNIFTNSMSGYDQHNRERFIKSRLLPIIFSNQWTNILLNRDFTNLMLAQLSNKVITIKQLSIQLYDGLLTVLDIVNLSDGSKYSSAFLPYMLSPVLIGCVVFYKYVLSVDKDSKKDALILWRDCISTLKEISERSPDYAYSINIFSNVCNICFFDETPYLYNITQMYLACNNLNLKKIDMKPSLELLANMIREFFVNKDDLLVLDNQEVKVLNYISQPVEFLLVPGIKVKQSSAIDFLATHVKNLKKFGDVLVLHVGFFSEKIFSVVRKVEEDFPDLLFPRASSCVLTLDNFTLYLMQLYVAYVRKWQQRYQQDVEIATPMKYPLVVIYQSGENKQELRCVEVHVNSDGCIFRTDCTVQSSYLLRRASRSVADDDNSCLGVVLNEVQRQSGLSSTQLSLKFDVAFFDQTLVLIRQATYRMLDLYVNGAPLSRAYVGADEFFDDPVALSRCSSDDMIGLFVLACMFETLRENEERSTITQEDAMDWLNYLLSFAYNRLNVQALGAPNGIRTSSVLREAPRGLITGDKTMVPEFTALADAIPCSREDEKTRQQAYCLWFRLRSVGLESDDVTPCAWSCKK